MSTTILVPEEAPRLGALLDRLLEAHAPGLTADDDLDVLELLLGWSPDPVLRGHLVRTAADAHAVALRMCSDADQTRAIRWGAMLHDIGKVGVCAGVARKCGPLTAEETAAMRRHTALGAEMVAPLRQGDLIATIVAAHHERWDGSGYPDGLAGTAIPLGARIVSVVDAYDAMSCDRPYREALAPEDVARRLREGRGTQWQPEIVDLVLDLAWRALLARRRVPADDLEARSAHVLRVA